MGPAVFGVLDIGKNYNLLVLQVKEEEEPVKEVIATKVTFKYINLIVV